MRRLATFGVIAFAGLGLLLGSGCKKKGKKGKGGDKAEAMKCPSKFRKLPKEEKAKDEIKCKCKAGKAKGSVWGNKVYTTDSSICAAAVHAGVLKKGEAAVVTLVKSKGCKGYNSKKKNGITSSKWGSFKSSFYFPDRGDGKCPKIKASGKCPARFKAIAKGETKITCKCPKTAGGTVYGTGIFTGDSSICAAAVHTGAISKDGGEVTAKAAKGCKAYAGSKKNGISSSSWGSYPGSFYIKGKGDGVCKQAHVQGGKCPPNFRNIPGFRMGGKWKCKCPKGKPAGTVWGYKTYTTDSNICAAAIHAGAVKKKKGGKVTIFAVKGCAKYKGKKKKGIKSNKWGSFPLSAYFKGKGKGKCAK